MLEQALLEKILEKALSTGAEYADVFVEWKRPSHLLMEDGKIERAVAGTVQGAGIRLIRDGRTSYAHSNELDGKSLLQAAASLAGDAGGREVRLKAAAPGADFTFEEPPDSVPLRNKAALIRAAEAAARSAGAGIRQVTAIYRDSVQKVQIATSGGVLAVDERVHTLGVVQVVAQKDGVIQTGYEPLGGLQGFEIFRDGALVQAAGRAARRALMMLSARRAPGGRMPVVISSEAGGTMIHEAIGHGLEADLAWRGLSRFSGMMGKKVASPLVTVIDDATLPGRRGSFRFDDEGTPSRRNVLVKDGVLTGYMYDRLTAMKEGVPPTGNGRRESFAHRPIPRMTNTFIAPGGTSPEEVLRSTPRGLLVRRMGGGQVNTVTGDFVFDVQEGYIIEGGTQGEPVRGATLTGSGPEVLLAIDMVGSDLGFSIGTCGKDAQGVPVSDAMPTLRIPEIVVGGEV